MKIRTRFAPSPTGFLHIGGLRTALYNYLYAKKYNGDFILRIEDTDQSRLVDKATYNLLNTLEAYGLHYDEGPNSNSNKGPYIQSQRLQYYNKYALKLIHSGDAYVCFQNNLDETSLTPEYNIDMALNRMKNDKFVIKLKINKNKTLSTYDEIRGKINFDLNLIDDFIIIKSDGYPTYHFANVVDDYLMEISHVIRGEEWLPSLPKHIMLYQYLGWKSPKFCHLPLLLNSDKSKLSKRQGDVAAEEFLQKGFLKDAIINFVALLGWHPTDNQEIFSLKELISTFSIDRINKSGAVFDIEKLNWVNAIYIRNLKKQEFYLECEKILKNSKIDITNKNKLLRFSNYIQERINNMNDILKEADLFYNIVSIEEKELKEFQYLEIFKLWVEELQKLNDLNKESINNIIKKTKSNLDISGKNLFLPLRLALIGFQHGPDIFSIIHILGLKDSIKNLTKWIK